MDTPTNTDAARLPPKGKPNPNLLADVWESSVNIALCVALGFIGLGIATLIFEVAKSLGFNF